MSCRVPSSANMSIAQMPPNRLRISACAQSWFATCRFRVVLRTRRTTPYSLRPLPAKPNSWCPVTNREFWRCGRSRGFQSAPRAKHSKSRLPRQPPGPCKSRPVGILYSVRILPAYASLRAQSLPHCVSLRGAEKSTQPERNLRDIEAFASRLSILPYDREAAMHTGSIRAALARVGTPIEPYDQMIAGHARSRGLIVVTANTDEFKRVPGISVEDWTTADASP